MVIFGDHKYDFEADIRIVPLGPTTRRSDPFNGIRWDFCYAEDLDEQGRASVVSMVWPEFVSASGETIPSGVPIQGQLHA